MQEHSAPRISVSQRAGTPPRIRRAPIATGGRLKASKLALNGETATVSCTLVTMAVGQVGAATPRRDSRRVTFTLAKRDGVWVITDRR